MDIVVNDEKEDSKKEFECEVDREENEFSETNVFVAS